MTKPSIWVLLLMGIAMMASGPMTATADSHGDVENATPAEVESATDEENIDSATDEEVTSATAAEVKAGQADVKLDVALNGAAPAAQDGDTYETGDIEITNSGMQAVFINSNVTINGGKITAELHKHAAGAPEKDEAAEAPSQQRPTAPPSGGNGGEQPEQPSKFEEAIKDATKEEGLFTVYTKEDRSVMWEIQPGQLHQNYLLSAVISRGGATLKPGDVFGGYDDSRILYFRKNEQKLEMMQRNVRFKAGDSEARQRALDGQYTDSLVASLPIAATEEESGAFLVDMTGFFMSDYFQISNDLRMAGGYGLDQQNSYIDDTKVLPENVLIMAFYNFRGQGNTLAVPDPRSLAIHLLYNMQKLDDNTDFEPRQPDYRIGYFLEANMDFSKVDSRSMFNRFINKWDIRKASPELEMSPPAEPLVFWIQNTTPKEYRKAIRDGVLLWNDAFEKIGIKDAIVVKEQPADAEWDAADTRYNVIYWNESYDRGYAYGQWIADPRTGEIIRGAFVLESVFVRGALSRQRLFEPEEKIEQIRERFELRDRIEQELHRAHSGESDAEAENLPTWARFQQHHHCNYAHDLAEQTAAVMTMKAAAEGVSAVTGEAADEIVYQYLKHVAAHEMGHVLGLRHNFKGTTLLSPDELDDPEGDIRSSSLMAYEPLYFNPDAMKDDQDWLYTSVQTGPYDHLAIQYGYDNIKPASGETEADALAEIAEKQELTKYTFATDEDVSFGLDPLATVFTLSNEPLAYSEMMTGLYKDTVDRLPDMVDTGESYDIVRDGFVRMLNAYMGEVSTAVTYLGGIHTNRVKKGGEYTGVMPLDPVSPAKQREALDFIMSELLSPNFYDVEPELLNQLGTVNWYHWGSSGATYPDVQLRSVVANFFDVTIYNLYSTTTVRRIMESNKHRHPQAVSFDLPEYFDTIYSGVWSETLDAADNGLADSYSEKEPFIDYYKRVLQRLQIKRLIALALEPPFGMPEDARTLAWQELNELEEAIDEVLEAAETSELDAYSKAHLQETQAKLERALDAELTVGVEFW